MNGVQKLFYLPEPHTDFIYAVIAEELGLIGATLVLALLLRHHLARPARRAARAGLVRRVPGARADDDGRGAGVREHQRRARADADQGHSAAVRQRRRLVAAVNLVGMGVLLNVSQHASIRGMTARRMASRRRCAS